MTSLDPDFKQVSTLIDRAAIQSVLTTYCRAVDRCDVEATVSCFHDDAEIHHGPFSGSPSQFIQYVIERLRELTMTQHALGNINIELDGNRALVESAFQAVHIRPDACEYRLETFWGRWCDHFEKRSRGWAVAHRTVVHDGSESRGLESAMPGSDLFVPGHRDTTDVSYQRLPDVPR